MRFKIDFKLVGQNPFVLPANYHVEFSSWIYKMLHFQSDKFTQWLKNKSYMNENGEFRLFTFSDIIFEEYKTHQDKLLIQNDNASMILSFYADEEIEPFVYPVFENQEFKIGDKSGKVIFKVDRLEKVNENLKNKRKHAFRCLSPMLISEKANADGPYISPEQKDFDKHFFKNLMFKYANLIKFMGSGASNTLTNLSDLQFQLKSKPKSKIIKIKTDTLHQKSVKGYVFDYVVNAPVELLKIGLNGGFGELNYLGFGCTELISQP